MEARALTVLVLALGLVSCGGSETTIRADGAARTVTDLVFKQTGFHATDVSCPSGVDAEVGGTFDCHFTGPEGPYVAHVRIERVEGESVTFHVDTRPVAQGARKPG